MPLPTNAQRQSYYKSRYGDFAAYAPELLDQRAGAQFAAPEPTYLDQIAKNFQTENIIGASYYYQNDANLNRLHFDPTPGFNPDYYAEPYRDVLDEYPQLMESKSYTEFRYIAARIDRDRRDREVVQTGGFLRQFATGLPAGMLSPEMLIPYGTIAKVGRMAGLSVIQREMAKTLLSRDAMQEIFRRAARPAAEAGLTQIPIEMALRDYQPLRTNEEMVENIQGAFLFSSILGGAAAALGVAKRSAIERALTASDQIADDLFGEGGLLYTGQRSAVPIVGRQRGPGRGRAFAGRQPNRRVEEDMEAVRDAEVEAATTPFAGPQPVRGTGEGMASVFAPDPEPVVQGPLENLQDQPPPAPELAEAEAVPEGPAYGPRTEPATSRYRRRGVEIYQKAATATRQAVRVVVDRVRAAFERPEPAEPEPGKPAPKVGIAEDFYQQVENPQAFAPKRGESYRNTRKAYYVDNVHAEFLAKLAADPEAGLNLRVLDDGRIEVNYLSENGFVRTYIPYDLQYVSKYGGDLREGMFDLVQFARADGAQAASRTQQPSPISQGEDYIRERFAGGHGQGLVRLRKEDSDWLNNLYEEQEPKIWPPHKQQGVPKALRPTGVVEGTTLVVTYHEAVPSSKPRRSKGGGKKRGAAPPEFVKKERRISLDPPTMEASGYDYLYGRTEEAPRRFGEDVFVLRVPQARPGSKTGEYVEQRPRIEIARVNEEERTSLARTFDDQEPQDPREPWEWSSVGEPRFPTRTGEGAPLTKSQQDALDLLEDLDNWESTALNFFPNEQTEVIRRQLQQGRENLEEATALQEKATKRHNANTAQVESIEKEAKTPEGKKRMAEDKATLKQTRKEIKAYQKKIEKIENALSRQPEIEARLENLYESLEILEEQPELYFSTRLRSESIAAGDLDNVEAKEKKKLKEQIKTQKRLLKNHRKTAEPGPAEEEIRTLRDMIADADSQLEFEGNLALDLERAKEQQAESAAQKEVYDALQQSYAEDLERAEKADKEDYARRMVDTDLGGTMHIAFARKVKEMRERGASPLMVLRALESEAYQWSRAAVAHDVGGLRVRYRMDGGILHIGDKGWDELVPEPRDTTRREREAGYGMYPKSKLEKMTYQELHMAGLGNHATDRLIANPDMRPGDPKAADHSVRMFCRPELDYLTTLAYKTKNYVSHFTPEIGFVIHKPPGRDRFYAYTAWDHDTFNFNSGGKYQSYMDRNNIGPFKSRKADRPFSFRKAGSEGLEWHDLRTQPDFPTAAAAEEWAKKEFKKYQEEVWYDQAFQPAREMAKQSLDLITPDREMMEQMPALRAGAMNRAGNKAPDAVNQSLQTKELRDRAGVEPERLPIELQVRGERSIRC